jgi:hypothetical protein
MLIDVIHPEFLGAKSTVKELLIQLAAREGLAREQAEKRSAVIPSPLIDSIRLQ